MWLDPDREPSAEAVPAATVVLVRDRDPAGLEVLLLRRDSRLEFVGGMWVFPGGRVDPDDREGLDPTDALGAARRAAVRESAEEAGLEVDEGSLVVLSNWTPPPQAPKRFATWFFLAPAPPGAVTIDDGEIRAHRWAAPADALALRDAGEIELAPPTWVTLAWLAQFASVTEALDAARAGEADPSTFVTRIARVDGGLVAMWAGDAGYESGDPAADGPRHRLWMVAGGWRYEAPHLTFPV